MAGGLHCELAHKGKHADIPSETQSQSEQKGFSGFVCINQLSRAYACSARAGGFSKKCRHVPQSQCTKAFPAIRPFTFPSFPVTGASAYVNLRRFTPYRVVQTAPSFSGTAVLSENGERFGPNAERFSENGDRFAVAKPVPDVASASSHHRRVKANGSKVKRPRAPQPPANPFIYWGSGAFSET